jgi:DNA-binding transcriptional regulator YhcF (GntR family)
VTLKIHIDEGGGPPYEQVRAQISAQARSGELPVGYRLPTVRGLAEALGLAANTVAKAYRALEADGVIETRGRNGTFVAAAGTAAERELASAARSYAERARRLGTGQEAALAAVREALRAAYGEA